MDFQELILQGGALAVVLAAFLFILHWMLTTFTKSMRRIEKAQHVTTVALMSLSQQLLAHDLTVMGLNPASGSSFEERDSRGYQKYQEVSGQISDLRMIIENAVKDTE